MVKTTIGKRVVYTKRGRKSKGIVQDEVSYLEEYDDEDFLDLIQYIRWDDGGYGIRICYYVRKHGSGDENWIFANRPLSISPEVLGKLLKKASKKKWFISPLL
ncbi:MAG: hypothetical protein ACTSV7_03130 [Candidatus Baldrarchaeia archaeon]